MNPARDLSSFLVATRHGALDEYSTFPQALAAWRRLTSGRIWFGDEGGDHLDGLTVEQSREVGDREWNEPEDPPDWRERFEGERV